MSRPQNHAAPQAPRSRRRRPSPEEPLPSRCLQPRRNTVSSKCWPTPSAKSARSSTRPSNNSPRPASASPTSSGETWTARPCEKSGVSSTRAAESSARDVLIQSGRVTDDELSQAEKDAEPYEPKLGEALVARGVVTEAQLKEAQDEHARTGDSLWRVLVNRGFATPKQIADAQKYGLRVTEEALDEAAWAQLLLRTGLFRQAQLDDAILERRKQGGDLCQILLDRGLVRSDTLGEAVSRELGVPFANLKVEKPAPEAVSLLSKHLARLNRMIPVRKDANSVTVAMADPRDIASREQLQMMINMDVRPALAFEADILEAIELHYAKAAAEEGAQEPSRLERIRARLRGRPDTDMVSLAESVSIINLVASIIEGAINSRATDIHLEPQATELRVRYRIDGVLYDVMNLPEHLMAEVLSRIKVLANMDITERRHAQDGHFAIEVLKRKYDLRVATLPTVLGEKIVLRLLNPEDVLMGLRQLGLEPDQLEVLERMTRTPHGMLLVTGPIGSGKTTTLYSALSRIDILTENVVTIEDPVEYQLPGINQVQVDLHIDRTFAAVLRSVLRQDADTLLVGEIRDDETARIAVRAAMTGHLVFSTLHTNDALGAIATLRNLHVPPFLIASALICVVAQRLVRTVCSVCREPYRPSAAALREMGIPAARARRGGPLFPALNCTRPPAAKPVSTPGIRAAAASSKSVPSTTTWSSSFSTAPSTTNSRPKPPRAA